MEPAVKLRTQPDHQLALNKYRRMAATYDEGDRYLGRLRRRIVTQPQSNSRMPLLRWGKRKPASNSAVRVACRWMVRSP